MWISGGIDNNDNYLNDVWYSTDGVNWTEATPGTKFTTRNYHSMVVFNNKMYVHGGIDGGTIRNDAW